MPTKKTTKTAESPKSLPASPSCPLETPIMEHCELRFEDRSLDEDPQGRLGTNRALLARAISIGALIAEEKPRPFRVTGIGAVPGRLVQDLYWSSEPQGDLVSTGSIAERLFASLKDECRRLAENAMLKHPLLPDQLHIPSLRYKILQDLAKVRTIGSRVVVERKSTGEIYVLPLPDQQHIDATPKLPKEQQTVRGKLTGIGLDNRLEVNGSGLCRTEVQIDHTHFRNMQDGANVTARKVEREGQMVLVDVTIEPYLAPHDE
ncbi:MAG: hypothetical protein O9303_00010 [Silanimonas sp.]|jgi:hypothetical protein|nr:hypothetical protein [Silanimonas sp.]